MHSLENDAKNGDVGGVKGKQSNNITTHVVIHHSNSFEDSCFAEVFFLTLYGENKPFLT